MNKSPTNTRALLDPSAEMPPGELYDEEEDEGFSKSTAKSYWHLQVLAFILMGLHLYVIVMLCFCPLGQLEETENSTKGADGYGQCSGGGIVQTLFSNTSAAGWTNVTVGFQPSNIVGSTLVLLFLLSYTFVVTSYMQAAFNDPGYVRHLSKHQEVKPDRTHRDLQNCISPVLVSLLLMPGAGGSRHLLSNLQHLQACPLPSLQPVCVA